MSEEESLFVVRRDDWSEFASQLSKETDRGAALVGAAFLDHLLGALIEEFLIDDKAIRKKILKGPLAPLGGFYSRIIASYSLGLISEEEYNDLDIIRNLRNDFAHKIQSLSFSSAAVKKKLKDLRVPHLVPKKVFDTSTLQPRQLFITSAAMISTFLERRRIDLTDKRHPAKKFHVKEVEKIA